MHAIEGRVWVDAPWTGGVLYVGAFAGHRIGGDPVAWQLLPAPGSFLLEQVPPGRWYLHAVACPSWRPEEQRFPEATAWGSFGGPYGHGRPVDPDRGGAHPIDASPLWADLTYMPAQQPLLTEEQWEVVRHVQRRLSAPGEAVTLDGLCREVHLTRHYLATLFKRATGFSPQEYRARFRTERAKELLIETERSVLEVALEVGYDSPSHLHRLFARYLGIAPAPFRRRARALQGAEPVQLPMGVVVGGAPVASTLLRGSVVYEGRRRGLVIYVGAFPRPFPDTYPAAWAALPRPGPFTLQVPPGEHYILACYCSERMRYPGDMATAFADGGFGPVSVRDGAELESLAITLRDDDTAARFTGRWFEVFLPDGRQRGSQIIPERGAAPVRGEAR
ncbi:helix-turn-helix domain-containing protein [Limnochorda pilosa]|uniref:HTH araC/xylS-type domain-containing protein n=1 Tax=Limnochorda pilosa TaxID=1555112 RepID=A0A0K2SKR1_LIMPI|nr:AraC family transcriptional regulator [Limnochorda pilosa]BAS27675.1 hypothetical protein LIP_1831 [Limnochorda pilosa]